MTNSRQLAAIMFTDIQGYTALMQQNEAKAVQTRDKHRRIFNSVTEKYKGNILQYYGDGTLSIFASAVEAVQCGIEMQLGFREDPCIPVRIGIHTGDIFFNEEEIIGDSVNVAARIESLAVPGSIFISEKVFDEIKNQKSIQTTRLQTFKLKNVERPIEVYAIANAGLVVPSPVNNEEKPGLNSTSAPQESAFQQEVSLIPVLATKLYVPPVRPEVVHRPRLLEQLNKGLQGKLTLISAPAGFGKSTLISEWIAGCQCPAAWLSLDEGDSDPTRFLTYLLAALQKIAESFGAKLLSRLQSTQPPPMESILTALVNEITTIPDHFVLVLDDYHRIDAPSVDHALTFLLEHLPPQMHLAIVTREDPPLPLARLRGRGQLTELRANDLRFTSTEAAGFLKQVVGLSLSAQDIIALETHTEGWITGLQMAALSLQGRTDTVGFIRDFTGSHRFILDYLVEEVLQRQSERVRSFLLQTSILDRLCGELCDTVTAQKNGADMLEGLERGNLFVVPLDDQRRWYRYHHLFADVLHTQVSATQPDLVPILHQRASKWYERYGSPADAIRHAVLAVDFERAAGLIELAWPAMDERFQSSTWLNWVKALPDELVRSRPVLIVGYAWALLNIGEIEGGAAWLREAEQLLSMTAEDQEGQSKIPNTKIVVVDETQFRYLPASISTARAYHAQALGQVAGSIPYAQQALEYLPKEDHLRRGPAAALLGLAQWANGDLEAAHQALADAMANFQLSGNLSFAISGTYGLADIRIAQGRLRDAIRTYEQALQLALKQGWPPLRGTADLYLGLGDLHRERGDLITAILQVQKSKELGEDAALPDWPHRLRLVQARIKETEGDLEGAIELLGEADRLYYRSPVPDVRPIAALRARIWIRQGNLDKALRWMQERGLSIDDQLNYLSEFEHITLARILIAQYTSSRIDRYLHDATALLERLLIFAEAGDRMGSVIEILLVQVLAHEAQGNTSMALAPLQRALALAEPEGYIGIFVNEGTVITQLLSEIATKGIMPDYVRKMLTFWDAQGQERGDKPDLLRTSSLQPLIEPLSQRELEVLQLIAQGLSNQEISRRLFLALSTVKGHNQNIYGKLEVQRRTEAIARARELGLL